MFELYYGLAMMGVGGFGMVIIWRAGDGLAVPMAALFMVGTYVFAIGIT